ncbi:MAG: hypothetical protein M1819_000430 [Sarea resinae]|nr:MAG: hypothetical protein M1819_000430 [Sarea resinae]
MDPHSSAHGFRHSQSQSPSQYDQQEYQRRQYQLSQQQHQQWQQDPQPQSLPHNRTWPRTPRSPPANVPATLRLENPQLQVSHINARDIPDSYFERGTHDTAPRQEQRHDMSPGYRESYSASPPNVRAQDDQHQVHPTQRFSFMPSTPPAPEEEDQYNNVHPAQRRSYTMPSGQSLAPQNQQSNLYNRDSILLTPIEMSSPTFSTFTQPVPADPTPAHSIPTNQQPHQIPLPMSPDPFTARHTPSEKPPIENDNAAYHYPTTPPPGPHPAQFAPYAEPSFDPQSAQGAQALQTAQSAEPSQPAESTEPAQEYQQPSSPGIPQSPGPLPFKDHHEPGLSIAPDVAYHQTSQSGPIASPGFAPIYNPEASTGPNGAIPESHQPGQITHPNMQSDEGGWKHSLFGCTDVPVCCIGLWCPCILYGKTQYRLSQRSAKKDPTDLLGYDICNGSCTLMALLCGCQWIPTILQHSRIRRSYKLNGNCFDDCIKSFCCGQCQLIRDELEVRDREQTSQRWAGPSGSGGGNAAPYVPAVANMVYGPPPSAQ